MEVLNAEVAENAEVEAVPRSREEARPKGVDATCPGHASSVHGATRTIKAIHTRFGALRMMGAQRIRFAGGRRKFGVDLGESQPIRVNQSGTV
jgi:hypothetical protein